MHALVAVGAAGGHSSFDGGGHILPSGHCPRLFIMAMGSCHCCGHSIIVVGIRVHGQLLVVVGMQVHGRLVVVGGVHIREWLVVVMGVLSFIVHALWHGRSLLFVFVGGCWLLWACMFMGNWWLLWACTFVSSWWLLLALCHSLCAHRGMHRI